MHGDVGVVFGEQVAAGNLTLTAQPTPDVPVIEVDLFCCRLVSGALISASLRRCRNTGGGSGGGDAQSCDFEECPSRQALFETSHFSLLSSERLNGKIESAFKSDNADTLLLAEHIGRVLAATHSRPTPRTT